MTTTVMVAAAAVVLLAPAAEAGLVALLLWCQRSDARLRRQRLQLVRVRSERQWLGSE